MEHKKKDTFFSHQQKNVLIALLSVVVVFSILMNFASSTSLRSLSKANPNTSQASVGPDGFFLWEAACAYARHNMNEEEKKDETSQDYFYWYGIVAECVMYGVN